MAKANYKWILLGLLSMIWGSSFILIKKGLIGLTAFQLGSFRIVFASLFLLVVGFKKIMTIPKKQWFYIVVTAFVGTFFPAYLFAMAETEIDSSITAILNALTPINTLIISTLAFHQPFKKQQFIGVLIGFIGSMFLVLNGTFLHPNKAYHYALLVIVATLCYALNVNLIKKHLSNLHPLSITTGNFLVLIGPALIILTNTGFWYQNHPEVVGTSLLYIVVLGVLGTGIANVMFFKLIQISQPVFASSVTYIIPGVALIWGVMDGEKLTLFQLFGGLIVLFGVFLSSKK